MTEAVKRVVIVGGGTAGWLTAIDLHRFFAFERPTPGFKITVVESPNIPIIGVGESTLPSLVRRAHGYRLDERELIKATNATFKTAVKFVDWRRGPASNKPDRYFHGFSTLSHLGREPDIEQWASWTLPRGKPPYDYAVGAGPYLSDRFLAPKKADSRSFEGTAAYAYHIDAVLLGRYLRKVCTERGVVRIEDTVVDVLRADNGNIEAVVTRNGTIEGDLFIDCTGFARVLIGKVMQAGFTSYSSHLLCDTALAVQIPIEERDQDRINSFTTATARKAGWIWDIHLQNRRGIGYVHSSAHTTEPEAERTLLEYIGPRANLPSPRRIPMTIGCNTEFWKGNCIAIGLSGGFVEPLEATGIYTIEVGVSLLRDYFPDKSFSPALRKRYNELITEVYEDIRNFIVLHYCLSQRDDSDFWRDVRLHAPLPDSLRDHLEIWKRRAPIAKDFKSTMKPFGAPGYMHILAGMDRLPEHGPALDNRQLTGIFVALRKQINKCVETSVPHGEYLRQLVA